MATIKHRFSARDALYPSTVYAQFKSVNGTAFTVDSLAFDPALDEGVFFQFPAVNYASGNLTVRVRWYADTATSGVVRWGGALAAITAESDTQDIETKAFAVEQTVDDTHLGTVGQRLHEASLTLTNLDSIAAEDWAVLRLRRIGSNAADTMAGDALVVEVGVEYSDT
jgi:hypothetical protein